jgi:iron complex outermembrane receptor protein
MKRVLLRGASAATLVVVGGLWASQAMAQAAATPVGTTPGAAAEATGQVIVTATRRNQAIEHVPVAVSAFTAKQRQVLGIATTQQLSDFTPGLSYFASNDRAYIRGIGRNTVNLATESGVATYYNGIYYGANASIAEQHDTLFVDQIEVDRGPQNTLHGSNADGGTINYISAKPTKSFYAEGRVGVANYGEYYGEAVVSGPITDWLRFRVGGNYSSQSGGFFNNLDGVQEGGVLAQANNGNQEYFEAQLDANLGPHLDAWAMASAGDYETSFHTASNIGTINDYEFPNGALFPSGFYAFCATSEAANIGCAGGQPIVPGSVVTSKVAASSFPGNNPSNVNIRDFIQQYTDSNNQGHDLALATRWTYHFNGADLQYLGGFQQFYYNLGVSGTGSDAGVNSYQVLTATGPLTIFPGGEHTHFIENEGYFSNELSLSSTTPGPVQWIAGAYWYHEKYDQPVELGCYPFQPQMAHPINLGALLGGFGIVPAAVNKQSCAINLDTHLTYDSYAGYGQVTWQIDPQWKLEGAARYTDDRKDGIEDFRVVSFDLQVPGLAVDLTPFAVSPINPATGKPYPGSGVGFYNAASGFEERTLGASWDAVTGEVTLTWQPDSETLGYVKYSRGYKTGGFNGGQVAAFPETAPEYVDAIEGGVKKTFGSTFQINGAAFFYNYQNDQQPLTIQNSTGVLFSDVFNIPSVHTYGIELEANWHPFQPVVFTAQYTYLSAKIASMNNTCVEDTVDPQAILPGSTTAGCSAASEAGAAPVKLVNLVGSTLPESPANKISLNALYTLNFDPGNLILSASYIWKDKTYGSVFNIP